MTGNEAIKEIEKWTSILMFTGKCTVETAEAQKMAIEALEEVQQYRAIGTPEECLAAMEKQETSKVVDNITECCGYDFGLDAYGRQELRYCPKCGRKLDWSDENGKID